MKALSALLLVAFASAPALHAQCELEQLTAQDFGGAAFFESAAAVGGRFAVGGWGDERAYVIEAGPTGWRVATFTTGFNLFEPVTVDLAGDMAFLGNPEDTAAGWLRGSVYVHRRTQAGWTEIQRLSPSDMADEDGFGSMVAVDGDRMIAGASHLLAGQVGDADAAFYEFEFDGVAWVETQKFKADQQYWDFATNGTLEGDVFATGHWRDGTKGAHAGMVVVFERVNGTWTQLERLFAADAAGQASFGRVVVAEGGRPYVSSPGYTAGRVYVYERGLTGWDEVGRIEPPPGDPVSGFGQALDVERDRVLVGSYQGSQAAGAAYYFEHDGNDWTLAHEMEPPAGVSYGYTLALASDGGAVLTDATGTGTGIAFLHDVDGAGRNHCTAVPNSTGGPATTSAEGCGSVAANDLVLRAGPVPDALGYFFYGRGRTQVSFGNGFRCVDGPLTRSGVLAATAGELAWAPDLDAPPHDQITAGTTWSFQAGYRDPQGGGSLFNTSDGLRITFWP